MKWTEEDRQKMLSLGKKQEVHKGLITELLELEGAMKKENRRQEEKERSIEDILLSIESVLKKIWRSIENLR